MGWYFCLARLAAVAKLGAESRKPFDSAIVVLFGILERHIGGHKTEYWSTNGREIRNADTTNGMMIHISAEYFRADIMIVMNSAFHGIQQETIHLFVRIVHFNVINIHEKIWKYRFRVDGNSNDHDFCRSC